MRGGSGNKLPFTKSEVKMMFGISSRQALPDAEYKEKASFVRDTMQASHFMARSSRDYWFFNLDYRPDWNRLLSRHRSKLPDVVEWAVFGSEPGSVTFIAYDKDTDRDVVSLPLADWQGRS
jgi:hypothetical protein